MEINILLEKLKNKFGINTDLELSQVLGINPTTINTWKNNESKITEAQIANLVNKSYHQGGADYIYDSISPIVEFWKITKSPSRQESNWLIFPVGNSELEKHNMLKDRLEESVGLYFFYNSEGKVIYIGKTLKQNLWKEINLAYNRERSSHTVFLANHKTKDRKFYDAREKPKAISKTNVTLHDVAVYFSAYEVTENLVHNLEAFLIRSLPNDLSNTRIEKFKY